MFFTVDRYQTDLGVSLKSVFFSVNLNFRDSNPIDPPLALFPPQLLSLYSNETRRRCSYDLTYRRVNYYLDSQSWINFLIPDPNDLPDLLTWWDALEPHRLELAGEQIPRGTALQLLR